MKTLIIDGMSCQHCVKRVQTALEDLFPNATIKIDLASNAAHVENVEPFDEASVRACLDDIGYPLLRIE
jgi:copper chaperone CopZ